MMLTGNCVLCTLTNILRGSLMDQTPIILESSSSCGVFSKNKASESVRHWSQLGDAKGKNKTEAIQEHLETILVLKLKLDKLQ